LEESVLFEEMLGVENGMWTTCGSEVRGGGKSGAVEEHQDSSYAVEWAHHVANAPITTVDELT
jgi:hypothetical protein